MRAVQHSINPERSVSHSIPKSTLLAAALLVLSLPVLASDCIDPIAAIGLSDGRTGAPIRSDWFLEAVPQSQTITGHDFDAPVVIPNHQRTFLYVPEQPGEKHLTSRSSLSAGRSGAR